MKKLLTIAFTFALLLIANDAMAGSTSFYYKVNATATPTGAGKVYVNTKDDSDDQDHSTTSYSWKESGANGDIENTCDCKLFAVASDGYKFVGWAHTPDATEYISRDADYTISLTSTSQEEDTPAEFSFYAIFADASAPTLRYLTEQAYLSIKESGYTNTTLQQENITEGINYKSSNTDVATVDATGRVSVVAQGSARITAEANGVKASYVVTVLDDREDGKTQIGNGDFENWSTVTDNNHAPYNWNSFETARGGFASTVSGQQVERSTDHRPGSKGLYSAKIYSRNVAGLACAQGNLTTGYINAGAMTAVAEGNHNASDISNEKFSETISDIPEAVKVWIKFVPGAENANFPNARFAAVVHDAHNYITYGDPKYDKEENMSHVVATAEKNFPACDWTELTIPFEKVEREVDGQLYILVNIATNSAPGEGQLGDVLYVDDIELVMPETSGINNATSSNPTVTATAKVYNVAGQQTGLGKGLNIIRMSNGTVRKVVRK